MCSRINSLVIATYLQIIRILEEPNLFMCPTEISNLRTACLYLPEDCEKTAT